jgi:NTP pyrophosphatase (non-canonical NTP hydrolase)
MMDEHTFFFRSSIYKDILKTFGCKKQLLQLSEEIFEINKEINKFARGRGDISKLIEEFVDVKIMLYQLGHMFDELLSISNTNPQLLSVFKHRYDTKWLNKDNDTDNMLLSTIYLSDLSTSSTKVSIGITDVMSDEDRSKLSDCVVGLIMDYYMALSAMTYIKNIIIKEMGVKEFECEYDSMMCHKTARTLERMNRCK